MKNEEMLLGIVIGAAAIGAYFYFKKNENVIIKTIERKSSVVGDYCKKSDGSDGTVTSNGSCGDWINPNQLTSVGVSAPMGSTMQPRTRTYAR